MFKRVHIIGAGLSGLSAAVHLQKKDLQVIVHEAASQAGGRCRSYFDKTLDTYIDNGNHLILSGNRSTLSFTETIGSKKELIGPKHAEFAFIDLASIDRWTVRLNDGRFPTWVLSRQSRVPKTQIWDYFSLLPLLWARPGRTLMQTMRCDGILWERLLRPFFLAALNVEPRYGSALLARKLVEETLLAGGKACRPLIAKNGLSKALIDPAVEYLKYGGARVEMGSRLQQIIFSEDQTRIDQLVFNHETITLDKFDAVVLALPAHSAVNFIPGLSAPDAHRAIINAHYLVKPPQGFPPLMGVVNGCAEWLFAFDQRLSVTISNADHLLDKSREELAQLIWKDVAKAARLPLDQMPKWQIVIEKRATFAALPEQENKRPATHTRWNNLVLAGDWIANGLPATIEGAIRSGQLAAQIL